MVRRPRIDPSSRLVLADRASPPLAGTGLAGAGDDQQSDTLTRSGDYVELTARSHFSFLRGGSSPEALMQRARALGYRALGITDCDGLYGIVRALEAAEACGIQLIVGCELPVLVPLGSANDGDRAAEVHPVVVHVETHAGYNNLCALLTEAHARRGHGANRPGPGVALDRVCALREGLWAMAWPGAGDLALGMLRDAFGERLSLAVFRHFDGEDRVRFQWARAASRRFEIPVCATGAVRYATPADRMLYDVLFCIREGITLDEAGRLLSANAEAHLKSPEAVAQLFRDEPRWISRSKEIADACRFSMRELRYQFPSDGYGDPALSSDDWLRRRTYDGARLRYGDALPPHVVAQIEKELALIAHLEVAPYFLSVQDIVNIARRKDILCQGRGSAANSAVCFCLGITAVDPARSNLLFERFLSKERHEPPDIDVDFEHERREEVIQALYEKYGRGRAAMVSEVICYRGKSALRDVGKAFGFSLEQVERLSGVLSWWDGIRAIDPERLRQAGFSPDDLRVQKVLEMARAIQGCPRHLSTHVGGFILSAAPLEEVAPVEPASMQERTVVPWDKDDIDTLGFFKVDVLGLGMLTALRKALDFVRDDPRIAADTAIDRLAKIPAEDPRVYDALCRADTVGVFQIESRAQMAMLPRLRPRIFYDLVVEVAIVRPGPIQGGMVHPYLRRRSGEEPAVSPHPLLTPIVERTLGVPLFQEQVMQIAIVGAGYTGGEADQLRRDMAAWRRNGKLEQHRERLLRGFAERGIAETFGERLYAQIQGFGEYGFPESHAASFALLVYASAWVKVFHPAAFAAALVNSQPMGFYSPSTLLQDAERHGVTILPIDVQTSDWDCTVDGLRIRVGLRQVRGLGEDAGRRIERAKPFRDVEDLLARASLDRAQVEVLASSGALESLVPGRRQALWKIRAPRAEGLFAGLPATDPLPQLPPLARAEQLVLDYEGTGISVGDHPMRVLRPKLRGRVKDSRELATMPHGRRVAVAGLVICRQRPGTASGVVFITMEDEYGFINLVLWSKTFEQFRYVATRSALLLAKGKVEKSGQGGSDAGSQEGGPQVIYVIVSSLESLAWSNAEGDSVPSMSRDFH